MSTPAPHESAKQAKQAKASKKDGPIGKAPSPMPDENAGSCGQSVAHESARAQITGSALYIDDLPEVAGTLHAAPILSTHAHARLLGVDVGAALAMPGVIDVVLAADIPGDPILATFAHDEPILATDTLHHVGQVIGLVLADSMTRAREAARAVRVQDEPLEPILTIEQAIKAEHWVSPPVRVARGDAAAAIAAAPLQLEREFEAGGQEHFYLEGQIAYALPQEAGQWLVHASSQHPGEVQHWIAHALGIALHRVSVQCRRMGGGFGGKETQAGHLAVWAAIAARKAGRPVKLRLDRDDDFLITGKRHNFRYRYRVGFDPEGRILGLDAMLASQCGFSADLSAPVADRAVFHIDNTCYLEHLTVLSLRCRTNTQSNTAFRGFGGPQGMLLIETVIDDIARRLQIDPLAVRLKNVYGPAPRNVTHYGMTVEDNIAEPLMRRLAQTSDYEARRSQIALWNSRSPILKRGIALTPLKFGISFTATQFNQAGALVHVYTDGSVQVSHGGTEMGQGLHTKVCQIVADELGVPLERLRITASDTSLIPNASATAASAGTDLNGRAAQWAAQQIRERLTSYLAQREQIPPETVRFANGRVSTPQGSMSFEKLVTEAWADRIQLWSDGFYATPKIHYDKRTLTGRPFYYFAYGAACVEAIVDTLTGESRLLAADILQDVGRSINPALDLGQIEGAFIQGVGWLTTEELVWDRQGRLLTHAPSTYKIPTAGDLPARFRIDLWDEPNREDNVHGSKAVGEPPFMLAIAAFSAIRQAIAGALADGEGATAAVPLDAPATPQAVLKALHQMGVPRTGRGPTFESHWLSRTEPAGCE
jgi:xanthine dehydrogenase large subunit